MPNYTVVYTEQPSSPPRTATLTADFWKLSDQGLILIRKGPDGGQSVAGFRHPVAVWDADAQVNDEIESVGRYIGA